MKKCNNCHQELPTTEFWQGSGKCKCCMKKQAKKLQKAKKNSCAVYSTKRFEP